MSTRGVHINMTGHPILSIRFPRMIKEAGCKLRKMASERLCYRGSKSGKAKSHFIHTKLEARVFRHATFSPYGEFRQVCVDESTQMIDSS
jgi:hypothetical protein